MRVGAFLVPAICLIAGAAHGKSQATLRGVTAGVLTAERPTLVSLGFDWAITGDANRNAQVAVSYRAAK